LDPSRVYERVTNLPLPAGFSEGGSIQGVDVMQGENMDRNWKSSASTAIRGELSALLMADDLVKILGIR
jgi:hypothetical protein